MPTHALKYRADVDGLRAVAVLGVLLYHIDSAWLGGGYVGVDVFFVISGFLITAIIQREILAGNFSFLRFFERRIRRIVPALFAMFVVVSAVAWKILLPDDLVDLGRSLRYALFSVANVHFLKETEDYFNAGVERVPLLHTWSLAVEEQFYIIFPFLLILAHRKLGSAKRLPVVLGLVALASLLMSQWVVTRSPDRAFYLLPWRAWELLLGALLAVIPFRARKPAVDHALGIAGLGMILGSMLLYTHHTLFPGFSALLPCLGAALVIEAGRNNPGAASAKILSWKPFVFIGLISYSVYLWHWPMITLAKYALVYHEAMKPAIFGASLLLGFLSWKYVEQPFRNQTLFTRKKIYAGWASASLVFLAACVLVKQAEGLEERFPPSVLKFLEAEAIPEKYRTKARETYDAGHAPIYGDASRTPTMALWGDSHAGAILPALDEMGIKHNKAVVSFDMPSQPPIIGITGARHFDREQRVSYTESVIERLRNSPEITTIFLHCRWASYARGDNRRDNDPPPAILGHPFRTVGKQQEFISSRFNETMKMLLGAGKKVVLIYPVPELGDSAPNLLAKFAAAGKTPPSDIAANEYHAYNRASLRMLDAWADKPGVSVIRPDRKLMKNGRVKIRKGEQLFYRDDDHLSAEGAVFLCDLFEKTFANSRGGVAN